MARLSRDLCTVPNLMSLVRIAATPVVPVLWLAFDAQAAALAVGLVLGVTDLLDGIVARWLGQTSQLGALLDQLGDLVFEATCIYLGVLIGILWPGWMLVYLFREFAVTVMRAYVHAQGHSLPSSWLGKAKSSLLQYGFFVLFLAEIVRTSGIDAQSVAGVTPADLLVLTAMSSIVTGFVVSYLSAAQYARRFAALYDREG